MKPHPDERVATTAVGYNQCGSIVNNAAHLLLMGKAIVAANQFKKKHAVTLALEKATCCCHLSRHLEIFLLKKKKKNHSLGVRPGSVC